ncbi:MAG: sporulation initiation factor Spo0A C-terminal domain-containing protein [Oscillospiraceae bacterium]|nr:sporulation initiation factor Spo0A C-terminal domain-containing protein [Oscillospiraceae bacterium]
MYSSSDMEKAVETMLAEYVRKIGISERTKGWKFLNAGMKKAVDDETMLCDLSGRFYPMLAEMFNTTDAKVKKSIRSAIISGWDRRDKEFADVLFGKFDFDDLTPPSNSFVICTIADRVRLSCHELYLHPGQKSSFVKL